MKIKSIKIEIAGEDKELSLDEVRELRDFLNSILLTEDAKPIPSPYQPVIAPLIWNPYWSIQPPYTITTGGVDAGSTGAPLFTTNHVNTFLLSSKKQEELT